MDFGFSSSIGSVTSSAISLIIKVLAGLLGIVFISAMAYIQKQRKNYNIPVTIWIPRSDGKITDEINAKGGFFKTKNLHGGHTTSFRLKRKGVASVEIPPPHSKFLVGLRRKLYLIQKGIDDFEPVLPESFRYVTTPSGKKICVINLNCINQDATAWVEDNRENAKRRFTIHGFWEKYKDFIQITIFIFIVMLALYMNWSGLKEVVEGLQAVADALSRISNPSVTIT